MSASSVARRYARALMSLGTEDGQFAAYGEQLGRAAEAYAVSEDLRDLWSNPAHDRAQRMAGVEALVKHLDLWPAVANVMRLLIERGRGNQIGDISRAYAELLDEKLGRVRATVTSARPLTEEQQARLQQVLGARTGRQVTIETRIEPAIIGGVVAQVGSIVYDDSVRTRLERMREELRSH